MSADVLTTILIIVMSVQSVLLMRTAYKQGYEAGKKRGRQLQEIEDRQRAEHQRWLEEFYGATE